MEPGDYLALMNSRQRFDDRVQEPYRRKRSFTALWPKHPKMCGGPVGHVVQRAALHAAAAERM